jgi:cytochrome P450
MGVEAGGCGMSLPRLDHDPRKSRNPEASAPIEWAPPLGCWCVFDADTITAILKSTDFAAADFVTLHRELEQKIGIDCAGLIQVLHHIATANEGKRHAEIRRDVARVLTADAATTKDITARKVQELVPEFCRPGARVDLVQEIIRPICNTLFECLLGVAAPGQAENGVSASQIFDLYLGLNRRRDINAKTCAMIQAFSAAQDKLKTSPDYAVALSMLGYDSIVASLGCSLVHVLREHPRQRLCAMSFPRSLPATGVPYIERFAAKDCTLAGVTIGKGHRVRLYLDSGPPDGNAVSRPYFGRGRHSCLGEELSTWLWRTLVEELSKLPLTCTVESAMRRKPDWVFTYYSNVVVRFHASVD